VLDKIRTPFFIIAIILLAFAVVFEIGTNWLVDVSPEAARKAEAMGASTPGYGLPYMALLDGLLLFTVALIGVALIVPERIHGRIQGIITLIVTLLILIACITLLILAFTELIIMISLLLAPIFGTIAYFAIYSSFDTGGARIALSLIMTLKLGFAGCLVLAHQRFLQNKGLVLIVLTSLLAGIIVSFLHGFVPGFLVSITDAVAGIIVAILAAIWAIVFLVGSIMSVIKAIV
jgi:hypothetical protein